MRPTGSGVLCRDAMGRSVIGSARRLDRSWLDQSLLAAETLAVAHRRATATLFISSGIAPERGAGDVGPG